MVKFICIILLFINILTIAHGSELRRKVRNIYRAENIESIDLVLIDIPKYRDIIPNTIIYNQVLSYSKELPFGDTDGRSTNVHETVHSINNQLRNQYKIELKKNINSFYVDDGKAIIIHNPNITMRDIIPHIPLIVRGYRYNLYFVKQLGNWNDVPTYPIDEWSAYIAGAECAVDDVSKGIVIPKSDYVSGALEFSIYCTALSIAVNKNDPDYWNTHKQFKNLIQYFLIKSEKIFFEGKDIFPSDKQNDLLDHLRTHEDTKYIREFLISEFRGIFIR